MFDAASRVLNYVNAGHNAPIVFSPGGEVVRLEAGGSVVGLMRAASWAQGRVKLEAGDLLVAFTDGISEAMNHADDGAGDAGGGAGQGDSGKYRAVGGRVRRRGAAV